MSDALWERIESLLPAPKSSSLGRPFLVFLALLPWRRYSRYVLRVNLEGLRATWRSAHEVIGRNHWDALPELQGTKVEKDYYQVKETREAYIVEVPYLC